MYYAFTPNSVFKSVPPNGSEPTWQISMLYSIVPLIYVISVYNILVCQVGSEPLGGTNLKTESGVNAQYINIA